MWPDLFFSCHKAGKWKYAGWDEWLAWPMSPQKRNPNRTWWAPASTLQQTPNISKTFSVKEFLRVVHWCTATSCSREEIFCYWVLGLLRLEFWKVPISVQPELRAVSTRSFTAGRKVLCSLLSLVIARNLEQHITQKSQLLAGANLGVSYPKAPEAHLPDNRFWPVGLVFSILKDCRFWGARRFACCSSAFPNS